MPIKVEIEGKGVVAEFPDGTDPTVIDAAIKRDFFNATPQQKPAVTQQQQPKNNWLMNQGQGAYTTAQNVGQGLPLLEMAANFLTSAYGVPASGLVGLGALPWGLDKSQQAMETVRNALVYQPQTQGGQQLSQAAGYPMELMNQLGGMAGSELEGAGYPNLAAGVHSAIAASPVILPGIKASARMLKKPANISPIVEKGITKGIRPTVVGKTTYPRITEYMKRADTAIKTIIENEPNLRLTNEAGELVRGLPQNLKQFSQAVDQTKRVIFERYNALAQQAGEQNVIIPLTGIAKELETIAKAKVIKTSKPGIAKYAGTSAERYKGTQFFTAEEAQQAIAMLNEGLENFYKNPTYQGGTQAYIDSLIVNNLRKSLDNAIMNATGKQYQVLKNKYGSLKAIEREVTHRAVVDARKNAKTFVDLSDVFTGYHAIRGILMLEPATLAAAAGGKYLAWLYKLRNDPNRIVKTMFKDADKVLTAPSLRQKLTTPVVVSGMEGTQEQPKPYATLVPNGRK